MHTPRRLTPHQAWDDSKVFLTVTLCDFTAALVLNIQHVYFALCLMSRRAVTINCLKFLCSDWDCCLWVYDNIFFQLILGMVTHVCNFGPQEAETEGLPWVEASLGYTTGSKSIWAIQWNLSPNCPHFKKFNNKPETHKMLRLKKKCEIERSGQVLLNKGLLFCSDQSWYQNHTWF